MSGRRGSLCALVPAALCAAGLLAQSLPGTAPLQGTNDLADSYLGGLERFVLRETERCAAERERFWSRDFTHGAAGYAASVATNRARLARLLGVRDARARFDAPELAASVERSAVLGESATHVLLEVRWPALGDYRAEGLLLEPKQKPVLGNAVYIPHAGVTPEQVLGLAPAGDASCSAGFEWPAPGCRLVVPAVVSRAKTVFESVYKKPGKGQLPGRMQMPNREFVYRPAYVMGRHIIGYEVQAVLALVDWFQRESPRASVQVGGWGDGGMLAFYAAALDTRIDRAVVAGYFTDRAGLWREPIDRNVFGLLREFGDAEIATLIAPRALSVVAGPGPAETITRVVGKEGGAPGELASPAPEDVAREADKARALVAPLRLPEWLTVGPGPAGAAPGSAALAAVRLPDAAARERRLVDGMNGFSQRLLAVSGAARREFSERLDLSSPEAYDRSAEWYRAYYREEIMGCLHAPKLAPNVRSRLVRETASYACHEVLMDVLPDFVLTGYLLLPKRAGPGERRPVVVAQHGRGGTPRTLMEISEGGRQTYYEIGPRLAESGYVVFLPQNPYIFEDRYRQLVRRANPVKLTLYSFIYAQYEQLLAWLATLPEADATRVGFIGQSYGGKTAVRVPPLMPAFRAVISTGDFNEGVTKMASTLYPFSFALWDEYEMFEFDLGNTFNYSDLAGLAAPRAFMAERGRGDGVAWDEFVGYEYALVAKLYAALKVPERTSLHWFSGGHEIAVEPALAFFDRFLKTE